jgi:hypothetical protein
MSKDHGSQHEAFHTEQGVPHLDETVGASLRGRPFFRLQRLSAVGAPTERRPTELAQ